MSRLEKSVKNIILSFGSSTLNSVLTFISRTVFIMFLGKEYLGLSGLLMNVLGFLSITELGFSSAIGFSLYKPLAEGDKKTVSSLMTLYRKVYRIVAIVVAISGILLYFSLDFFIPLVQQPTGTDFAYFAFLFNIVVGYLFSYKVTLIGSDNQAYQLVPISAGFMILQTIGQIIVLFIFKNYIIYLVVQIICNIASMIVQNRYVTKKYKDINFYSTESLKEEDKQVIKRNIGGLVIAKIGDYLVNSTDNLIITKLVSLSATGIYSNYLMIRNIINGFIANLFAGITASMGNIVAVESDEKKLEVFNTMLFFSFFVYSFEAVCFMCLFNPFIGEIWLGKDYIFDTFTVFIIVLNNFLTGLRIPLITMKNVAGKYMEDVWIPFGFSGVNLVASIFLVKYLGVAGVFLGTIVGSLCTADWYRPIVIYKHVFHVSVIQYYKQYIKYVVLGIGYMAIAYWLCSFVNFKMAIFSFVIKCFISVLVPIIFNCLLFFKTSEFQLVLSMGKRLVISFYQRFVKRE